MEIYTVSFFGHRVVEEPIPLERKLEDLIRPLLTEKEYVEFLVGRNGEFDQLAASVVRRMKRTVRDDNSSLVLVLPYITAEYGENEESSRDYYDEIEVSPGRNGEENGGIGMTEKELRRMSSRELIEIIAVMKKTELELQAKLKKAEKQLTNRTIQVANAGSLAEAALSLSGVFDAAQVAADTYLQSLCAANADIEQRMAQTQKECEALLRGADQEAAARLQEADNQCAAMLASTDKEIKDRWETFQRNVQNVVKASPELLE